MTENNSVPVSVILLSFNNINIIGSCLLALQKSTYKYIEVIVLDCASKDGSPEYIKANFPWVTLVSFKRDPGVDEAHLYGVKHAKGKYIFLVSADVKVFPDTLARLVAGAEKEKLDLAFPHCIDWEGYYSDAGLACPFFFVKGYDLFGYMLMKLFSEVKTSQPFYYVIASVLFRRDAFLETPMNVNIGIYEEVEWFWRLQLKGKRAKLFEEVYVAHKRSASISGCRSTFYGARYLLPTVLVCARKSEIVFLAAPLAATQIANLIAELAHRRFDHAESVVKGWASAFKLIPRLLRDRAALNREIGNNRASFSLLQRYVEGANYINSKRCWVNKKPVGIDVDAI
jgi:GT2 family glycosyltransferase